MDDHRPVTGTRCIAVRSGPFEIQEILAQPQEVAAWLRAKKRAGWTTLTLEDSPPPSR